MENKVVAVVDGRDITEKHISYLVETLGPQRMMQFQGDAGRKKLIEELVNQELFYSYALKNGYDKEESYIEDIEIVKANLLKSYAIKKFLDSVEFDGESVKAYYEENKAEFVEPETVKASHILVSEEEKLAEVQSAIEAGEDFAELAMKHSMCPSKAQGGSLGFFGRGQMVPEFEEAVFGMEVGNISEPVKTQFGYHVIKLEDKKPETQQEFEEVKEEIEGRLRLSAQSKAYTEKIEALKEDYKVELL